MPSYDPSSGHSSTTLFQPPYLQKRRDGLCPSLMQPMEDGLKSSVRPGGLNKQYRTNSNLLLQIKERSNVQREEMEIKTLIESVHKTIDKLVGPDSDLNAMDFKPHGCRWKMGLHPETGAHDTFRMEVKLYADEFQGITNYMVDTVLQPRIKIDESSKAQPKGFKEAKEIFDLLCLKIRKCIVRLEFPEFPEGCKGRPFREVYQLNARVRTAM